MECERLKCGNASRKQTITYLNPPQQARPSTPPKCYAARFSCHMPCTCRLQHVLHAPKLLRMLTIAFYSPCQPAAPAPPPATLCDALHNACSSLLRTPNPTGTIFSAPCPQNYLFQPIVRESPAQNGASIERMSFPSASPARVLDVHRPATASFSTAYPPASLHLSAFPLTFLCLPRRWSAFLSRLLQSGRALPCMCGVIATPSKSRSCSSTSTALSRLAFGCKLCPSLWLPPCCCSTANVTARALELAQLQLSAPSLRAKRSSPRIPSLHKALQSIPDETPAPHPPRRSSRTDRSGHGSTLDHGTLSFLLRSRTLLEA